MEKTYMQTYYEEKIKADPERYSKFLEDSRRRYHEAKEDHEKHEHLKALKRAWYHRNKDTLTAKKRLKYQENETFREKAKQYAWEYKTRKKGEKDGTGADAIPAGITANKS